MMTEKNVPNENVLSVECTSSLWGPAWTINGPRLVLDPMEVTNWVLVVLIHTLTMAAQGVDSGIDINNVNCMRHLSFLNISLWVSKDA